MKEIAGDPRLGRLTEFDERSRDFPIRALLEIRPAPRSYTWRCGVHLDQGQEGACVGFSWAHELAARPAVNAVDDVLARKIYRRAQELDQWPGSAYSGTSVLAGAKAVQEAGGMAEYRWAFGLQDLVDGLGYAGPAVLGIDWHEGMFRPASDGRIRPTGPVLGGHAILAYRVVTPLRGRPDQIWLRNSWGPGWGVGGDAWLSWDDMAQLLDAAGEACIPVGRRTLP
jgi:hypothetical protein